MPFVTRAEWGARPSNGSGNVIGAHPKGVAVHYEGPKMGSRDHSKCDAMVRGIQKFHMDPAPSGRGWADIAYSYMVCEHGYVYEGRGVERGSAANGTTQANLDYYAVCGLIGEGDAVPAALLNGIRDGIELCRRHGAGDALVGHRDLYSTACPGGDLYAWVQQGCPRPAVAGGSGAGVHVAPVPSPAPTPAPAPAPKPAAAKPVASSGLVVDGDLGAKTIRRLQAVLGTPVDGVITPGNSTVVRAMQKRLGVAQDGDWGPLTTRALQEHYGTPVDGVLSHPSTVIAALQRALNAGRF